MTVLDASAVLALLFGEPGHERVAAVLDDACLSTVNLAEVLGRLARDGHDPEVVRRKIEASTIEIVPFDAAQATICAALLPATRALGLSLGDRACLALAASRRVNALTADRAWVGLGVGVSVTCIR